ALEQLSHEDGVLGQFKRLFDRRRRWHLPRCRGTPRKSPVFFLGASAELGLRAAKAIGDVPQNVSYAVKSAYALALLEPYLVGSALEPAQATGKPNFEDMVAKAQQSVVLILAY
ncbi:MAG: hypothetical protein Q7S40_08385, partial [Opitutaceae bacterium]|nr:hypothetical protein [Opitutaceae bacterium]